MSEWKKVSLGELAEINPSKNQLISALVGKNISFVGMADVSESGEINTDNIKSYEEVKTGYTYFQENDILFAKITPCMENGKGAIARNLHNGLAAGSTEFHIVRVNPSLADTQFISKILVSEILRKEAEKRMTGSAGQKRVPKEFLENYKIPLPPIEEQKKIAEILDKSSNLISLRKKQIEKLDMLVKARFLEMFGDPTTNPKGFTKRRLADECDIVTGNTPSRQVSSYYGNYIEWIKSDNINTPSVYLTTATEYLSKEGLMVGRSVEAGSILMTCIAGSLSCIGNVAIADRKVSFNQQINGIVPKKNNVWFMFEQFELSKAYIQSTINMALKGILSKGQLSELEFIFPSIELQSDYGNFVQQVEKQKTQLQKGLEKLELTYKALMQQYFN